MTVVNSIEALRALSQFTDSFAETLGYYAPGDQGSGSYRLDATDTSSPHNGGTVIVANDGGRWKLLYDSVVSLRQFGAKGDGAFNDTPAVQHAFDSGVANIFVNAGNFRVGSLNFGTNSTTAPSGSPQKLFGTGLSSAFTALPGTATVINARNIAGIIFEDFSIYGEEDGIANCEWLFDTSWTLGSGPSLNNSYLRLWLRGSGTEGNWLANNNNDCQFLKCVIDGAPTTTALQIHAPGGAVTLTECVINRGLTRAWAQNMLVSGGYIFGIEFTGVINSLTLNSTYMYPNGVTGACISTVEGSSVTLVATGGLFGSDASTCVFDCAFSSDSTIFNAIFAGGPEAPLLGPNARSALGPTRPVRLTLDGGSTETLITLTSTYSPTVNVGFRNFRNKLGLVSDESLNSPAPTFKGTLGTTVFGGPGSFVPLFGEDALTGPLDGAYLLQVTVRLASNPFIIIGTGLLPLMRKIGGAGTDVLLSTVSYMGPGMLTARAAATVNPGSFPAVEVELNGPVTADSVEWSITRM